MYNPPLPLPPPHRPLLAFTGDTLFIGSCGRPDLVGSVGYTAEHMSRLMFKTLKEQICTLPDDVQVSGI